jgi:pimeloyl-ACP methyl ester carboxylesterase
VLDLAALAAVLGLAVLVAADGSPAWRVVRVVAVAGTAAALVEAGRRGSALRRGMVSAVLGALVVPVGLGFLPHLVKDGVTILAVAGALVLAGGLILLVIGAAVLASGGGVVRRVAAIAGTLVVATVAALVVGPAVAATNVPHVAIGATPDSVGLDHTALAVETADGVQLAAWYVPSTNRAAVVLLHGAGSTRSNVLRHAVVLADHGYGVLLLDARGHGESDGRAMDFGWWGDADVTAAVDLLAGRADVDPERIGVVGLSMGGEEAIGASAADDRIRAVVAEGATARSAGDEAWLSEVYGLRGSVQEGLEVLQDWVTGLLTDAPRPISNRGAVERSGATRYLLVAAADVSSEVHTAEDLERRTPDRVEVWVVEGAGHTEGVEVAPDEWERRVVGFLDDVLLS